MILDQLVLHNFGVYRGRHVVDLAPISARQPIILVGGLNGGGKTTFLDALQLALYGKNGRCSNRGALSYDDFLQRSISKGAWSEGAAVEVAFRQHVEGREHSYRVHRSWDEHRKRVTVSKDGRFDPVLTETWAEFVEEVMPARISHLFFFDGEQIQEFADWKNSRELLATAVHALLGLDIVDNLSADLTVLERRKRAASSPTVDRKAIDELAAAIERREGERADLVTRRAECQNALDMAEKALRDIERTFKSEGGDLFERRSSLEERRRELMDLVGGREDEARLISEGAAPLRLVRGLLEAVATQFALEETARTSSTFGRMLRKRDEQLLNIANERGVERGVVTAIERFLIEDRQRVEEAAHIDAFLGLSPDVGATAVALVHTGLAEEQTRIDTMLAHWTKHQETLVDVERMLAGVPDQAAIEELLRQREESRDAVTRCRAKIELTDADLASAGAELERLRANLARKLEAVADAELAVEDNERLVRHSTRVRQTLEMFRSSVVRRHTRRIEQLVLEGFRHLLRKETLVTDLSIDADGLSLELFGPDRQILPPDRLSAGERQLLAVSLLWGLARASGRPLPAVIDTPLGRLDSSHRRHLVDRYFPFASHQVLLLSTDEEIDAEHHDRLKPWIGRSYRLDFDDRTATTSVHPGYFW
jgi:DNA sulfur modification protein DndD